MRCPRATKIFELKVRFVAAEAAMLNDQLRVDPYRDAPVTTLAAISKGEFRRFEFTPESPDERL